MQQGTLCDGVSFFVSVNSHPQFEVDSHPSPLAVEDYGDGVVTVEH